MIKLTFIKNRNKCLEKWKRRRRKIDLQVTRIQKKLETLFNGIVSGKFDENSEENKDIFYSRSISGLILMNLVGVNKKNINKFITDGFNDYGIDCIYKDENSRKLILIQSKLIKNGISCPSKGDVLKFLDGIQKVLNLDFSNFNEKILEKKDMIEETISDVNYKIEMILAYTGNQKLAKEIENSVIAFENNINGGISDLISHKIIDKTQIYKMALNDFNTEINIDNIELSNWGVISDGENANAYYGTVNASYIAELWKKYDIRLLAQNIRFFKGNSTVNNGIKNVLLTEPQNFVYYNNGIKIIANKIERKLKKSLDRNLGEFSLKGISIVNGAQTVGCIGGIYEIDPEKISAAKVFVHIISLENREKNYGEQITKLSNTQNKIENKDFASLDEQQERIRKELAVENIEYIYRNGMSKINFKDNFTIDEAIIAMGCYHKDVLISTIIKRAIGSIYDDLNKYPYKEIFNNELEVNLLWKNVKIYRICEECIKEKIKQEVNKKKLILVHGNRFILHMLYRILINKFNYNGIDVPESESISIIINSIVEIINNKSTEIFGEIYVANVFKNNNKCIELEKKIFEEWEIVENDDFSKYNCCEDKQITIFDI